MPRYLDIASAGGDVTVLLPHSPASYAITSNDGGGDYSASVPVNEASSHKITVDSGGGNISIAEAS